MKRPPGYARLERAQILRRDMTDAERILWKHLRSRQLQGFKFRRQMGLRGFIADFACVEARLVIEADGGQHDLQTEQDELRTAAFAQEGYRVLRFWNHHILGNIDGVLVTIAECFALTLPRGDAVRAPPSPQSGRGVLRIGFTGSRLDRADHLRQDEARIAELARSPEARLLRLDGMAPVVDDAGRLAWDAVDGDSQIFLGFDDGIPLFAPLKRVEAGQNVWGAFPMLGLMPPGDAAVWGAAYSLIAWHNRHGFCANCGAATLVYRAGWGRKCPVCGAEHFPRVDPVVIMLAEYEDRVLVGRGAHFPPGRYSALAGYVEHGESLEEAVAREVEEETGVKVSDVRYVASQPWPLSGALMIACVAKASSDKLTIDPRELQDAMWVDRAEVRAAFDAAPGARFLAPTPIAIASSLLRCWLESQPLAAAATAT